jgi:CheY-like chemotaxis protein
VRGGHETILVVEDEAVLRDMAHMILQDCGYEVLEAGSGAEALEVWQCNSGRIDLMLTDIVLPGGMSGRDLAAKLMADHPQLKIIFTSGYNVEETSTDFPHRSGVAFLQKPYTRIRLAEVVRQCLDN